MMTPGVGDVLSPLAKSAVDNLKLGYPAVSPNASMDLKLKVYDELASEAQDCYRRRPVRECGEDFQRAIAEYRRACKNGTSRGTVEMFAESLTDMADLVADMLIPAVTA